MNREQLLLIRTMEETAKVQRCAARALREGLHSGYPGESRDFGYDLIEEVTALNAVLDALMTQPADVWNAHGHITTIRARKRIEVEKYIERHAENNEKKEES